MHCSYWPTVDFLRQALTLSTAGRFVKLLVLATAHFYRADTASGTGIGTLQQPTAAQAASMQGAAVVPNKAAASAQTRAPVPWANTMATVAQGDTGLLLLLRHDGLLLLPTAP
jgi:hypothetical protein